MSKSCPYLYVFGLRLPEGEVTLSRAEVDAALVMLGEQGRLSSPLRALRRRLDAADGLSAGDALDIRSSRFGPDMLSPAELRLLTTRSKGSTFKLQFKTILQGVETGATVSHGNVRDLQGRRGAASYRPGFMVDLAGRAGEEAALAVAVSQMLSAPVSYRETGLHSPRMSDAFKVAIGYGGRESDGRVMAALRENPGAVGLVSGRALAEAAGANPARAIEFLSGLESLRRGVAGSVEGVLIPVLPAFTAQLLASGAYDASPADLDRLTESLRAGFDPSYARDRVRPYEGLGGERPLRWFQKREESGMRILDQLGLEVSVTQGPPATPGHARIKTSGHRYHVSQHADAMDAALATLLTFPPGSAQHEAGREALSRAAWAGSADGADRKVIEDSLGRLSELEGTFSALWRRGEATPQRAEFAELAAAYVRDVLQESPLLPSASDRGLTGPFGVDEPEIWGPSGYPVAVYPLSGRRIPGAGTVVAHDWFMNTLELRLADAVLAGMRTLPEDPTEENGPFPEPRPGPAAPARFRSAHALAKFVHESAERSPGEEEDGVWGPGRDLLRRMLRPDGSVERIVEGTWGFSLVNVLLDPRFDPDPDGLDAYELSPEW